MSKFLKSCLFVSIMHTILATSPIYAKKAVIEDETCEELATKMAEKCKTACGQSIGWSKHPYANCAERCRVIIDKEALGKCVDEQ